MSEPSQDVTASAILNVYRGPDLRIMVAGEAIRFEWHHYFGPMPVTDDGAGRNLGPKHPFWRAVSLWALQGRRVEGGMCTWHEPKPAVLVHMGGRHYRVVEHGEEGCDW